MLSFSSFVSNNGPASGVATIWNAELTEIIDSQYFEWSEEIDYIPWVVCLPSGCYVIMVDGDCCIDYGANYYIEADAENAEVSVSGFDPNDSISGTVTLSVNTDCSSEQLCSDHFSVTYGEECGEVTFEVEHFVENVPFTWHLGDGTTVLAGPVLTHVYNTPGQYTVNCIYANNVCNGYQMTAELDFAQCEEECTTTNIQLTSTAQGNQDHDVYWVLTYANGGLIQNGMTTLNLQNPSAELDFCLEDSCYILILEGLGVTEQFLDVLIETDGESLIQNIDIHNENLVYITFGINSDCSIEDECSASFQVQPTETPGQFVLTNTSSPMPQDAEWIWSFGNGQHSINTHADVTYTLNGVYEVCLVMYLDNCVSSYCQDIIVEGLEAGCTAVDASITSYFLQGNGPEVIHWTLAPENGNTMDSGQLYFNQMASYDINLCLPSDCYVLSLEGLGVAGQFVDLLIESFDASIIQHIDVENENLIHVYFGVNSSCTVGIDAVHSSSQLKVYPNPAQSLLYIGGNEKWQSLEVVDMTGKTVLSLVPNTQLTTLDVSHLASGIYILKAKGLETTTTERIVIEH
jgi:PKD repeat protein